MNRQYGLVLLCLFLWASAAQAQSFSTWRYRVHATDCKALTSGQPEDLCYQQAPVKLFKCEPSVVGQVCDTAGEWIEIPSGTVTGPATSTDNAIAVYNGTTGTALKNSTATVDAAGLLTAPGGFASGASPTTGGESLYCESSGAGGDPNDCVGLTLPLGVNLPDGILRHNFTALGQLPPSLITNLPAFIAPDPGPTNLFPSWNDSTNQVEFQSASAFLAAIGAESSTSNAIDPDRLSGDAVDDDRLDVGVLPDAIDFGSKTSFKIPTGTNPTVSTQGQLAQDSDGANVPGDIVLRGSDGTNQVALARKLYCLQATVVAPNDMADTVRDGFLLWSNESGMTYTIVSWAGWAGTDDTTLAIEQSAADGSGNANVATCEIATNGAIGNHFSGGATGLAVAVPSGNLLWLDFDDTDLPTYVKMTICGWFNSAVD